MPETPTDTQYAGLTATERILAAVDLHMSECDAPTIDDCPGCGHRLRVIRGQIGALAAAGRLLPEGGETRTEWEVRWYSGPDDGIALHEQRLGSRRDAEVRGPQRVGQYGITRYSVHHREHRIFEDGSSWTGPWVEVTD